MKKLSFFLMAMLFSVMSFAAEETATLSFANKAQRTLQNTNQQVWTQNGITLTNDKASSTSAVADYANPARFYKSSKITVKCDLGTITNIVFDCNSNSYATALKSSITSGTVTVSSDKVTVVPATESDTYVINSLTGGQVRMDALTVTYVAEEEDPNTPVYTITATSADATMGSITGAGEYKQGKEVSLTAVANPGYEFVKWSNESTENPLVFEATENVTLTATFQAQTPITIAEANQLKDNATGILKEFVVTYVYKSYIHIQDETGYAMAYKYDYGLKAGDKVTGFTFSKTTHNGLAQLVPTTTKLADLGIVSGEAPAVPEVTTAPTGNYQTVVKLMNVKMTGSFTTSSNTTLVATCPDETTINVYNNKNLTYTFADGKTYNIVGGITQYNNKIQVLAYAIEEYVAPVVNHTITVSANPAEAGTVTGGGEFEEGTEATLTATANEGYEFTCWTSGEDTVSTANPYTFAVTANVALVANFKEVVVEEPVEAKLYLTPNANWKQGNARFAAYFFGNGETWVGMTKVEGETDLYEVTIPTDKKYPNVIFCRMNPGAAANNWNNKWNQTSDLVIPTDGKNHYTVKAGTWDKGGGTWSIWPVPTVKTYVDITITVTANAPASIKWANAGDKLADATEYVAMTAGENNTYTYTLAQVDEVKGVDYTVKVGEAVSTTQNTSKNVTADFKALLPQVAVQGVNNWDGTDKMTIADDYLTASITLPLVAKKYDLKLTVDATWKGTTSNKITRENNSSAFTGDSGNGSITADIAGDYVFTYTYATQTLTVTYPALTVKYNVTVTAENGTVEGAGEYEENAEATLTATAAEGYEFVNWTVGDSIVSTENPYKFTVTADLALVANFKEVVKAIEVKVTDATATSGEWSIDLAGSWNDQALTIKLWQDNTQGFGSYAPNTETGYYILLGAKELTPTTEGVYADNGDGTFTFTCSATDGTTQYNITVTGNNPTQGGGDEEYPIIDDAITNLTFNLDEEPYSCMGGPSEEYGIELYLVLGEEDGMGTFTLTEASEIYVQGSPATFISGYLTDIDTSAPAANAVIVAKLPDGSTFEFHIAMSSTPVDATVIVVENATLAIDSTFLFNNPVSGDVYEYSLTMSGNWTDSTNTTYLVTVEFPVYDPATTEEQERLANIKVGDFAADDAPFLGMVEDFLTITNVNGVITAKGLVSGNGLAFDITISGSLAQDPSTGVDNINTTVAPVKVIENGQIFIISNGVKYNAQGAKL